MKEPKKNVVRSDSVFRWLARWSVRLAGRLDHDLGSLWSLYTKGGMPTTM